MRLGRVPRKKSRNDYAKFEKASSFSIGNQSTNSDKKISSLAVRAGL